MKVGVLGAGTMGSGIAQVVAQSGDDVVLRDVDSELVEDGIDRIQVSLEKGIEADQVTDQERIETLKRIEGTTDLSVAVGDADLVIEAVPEDITLKKEVFSTVESLIAPGTVLASNTSSLPLSELGSVLNDPSRLVGLHFFNPPPVIDLVEIVLAEQTNHTTRDFAVHFVEGLGKESIVISETPGFASSRLGVVLSLEAMRMVEANVADPVAIDTAMVKGYNHPMGPLELSDLIGLDVRLDIALHLREELGERFRPPQILRRKVRADKLGKKTGEGIFVWQNGEKVGRSGRGGGGDE